MSNTRMAQRSPSESAENNDEVIDLGAIFGVLWRGKFILLLPLILGGLFGKIYADTVPTPMFRSSVVIMLNNRQEQVVDLGNVMSGLGSDMSDLNTEVQVLRSRNLLGQVVDTLDLTEDPEFNRSLRAPSEFSEFKALVASLLPFFGSQTQPAMPSDPEFVRQRAINTLLGQVEVRNLPQTLVFNITVTSEDREKAALIADTLAETYIQDQMAVKFEATEQATQWLTERVSELQVSLEEAEQALKDFRAETSLVSAEALTALEIQAKDLRDRIQDSETLLAETRARLDAIRAAETPAEQVDATNDQRLQRLLARIDEPEIATAFENRLAQITTRLEAEIARSMSQITTLRDSLTSLTPQIEQQSQDLITLQQLTREAEASRLLYEYFLTRLKETSAQQGIQQADSRIISSAVVPSGPSSPRTSAITAMSALLGMMLGLAIIVFRELSNRTFRSAEQLESMTGYRVAGQVPVISNKRRKATLAYLKSRPASAAAEAIRNLRTSLMLSNLDKPPQVIMVCSSLPGEGKTTIAMALAQNFASMEGRKTLLIEGDIRRRVFSEYMDTKKTEDGLVALVAGNCSLEDVLLRDELIGADVLKGDKSNVNAADVFSSDRFAKVLTELRGIYDTIIIDTPPALLVPDARVIAQHVDTTAFVVYWDQTRQEQLMGALREFESVGKPVGGLVLNQINVRKMKRYGYGYGAYVYDGAKYYTN